ncbi:hypothetical protein Q4610_02150 [Sphingobium sp. HBC34]|uniref:Anti-sigma factor n=1 Tax=Sphingobium cyanobacteriorum TaxID=3063954 RepID=A0ABT8ZHD8_9SPHN|nr:hypothetical protein [Sphingobium sp. HBC34]MDO7833836.1 hypothetical protein [Sphingobium sp. HBC34]
MGDWTTDDDRLMAYLDGAMDEVQMAAFEQELETRPELAQRAERFTANDALLRQAFDEPVPTSLTASVQAAIATASATATPGIVASNDNRPGWRRWQWPALGAAAAAAAAFLLVVLPGMTGNDMEPAVVAMLDDLPSGQPGDLGKGQTITPQLTAIAADGRYCREFVRNGGQSAGTGIACRDARHWTLEAFINAPAAQDAPDQIRTAGGKDSSALDAAYTRLGMSDPLGKEEEDMLLSTEWKKIGK